MTSSPMSYHRNPDSIGVIGLGFVGHCVQQWFHAAGHSRSKPNWEKVNQQKTIFLCLPTPYVKGGFDLSALRENIKKLSPGKAIVIKSTVLPGTTAQFQKDYPQHRFFFNPEFLTARTAWKDFQKPHAQIIGYVRKEDRKEADSILFSLPRAAYTTLLTSSEAEMLKLIRNNTLALRVTWANEIYDYCQQKGVDYDIIIRAMTARDPFIATTHWNVWQDDQRGYAGACFPKDTKAFRDDSNSRLIDLVDRLNEKYLLQKR